ncbi:YbaN family protein [Clostridium sp. UBA6640]|uniref:YbaN family protein n=1 Tax=Clostridium sp. UBA6640 TaxID=1946370 RepID=UPI0025C3D078|nr:YbaN family protein [Clostridium sp. UBA6640]
MSKVNVIKKYVLIGLGFLSLGLGIVGIVLPILPTTPFLLLASYCFAKGSNKFHTWFIGTKIYKNHLEDFVKTRAMTLRNKLSILGTAFTMLMIAFILNNNLYIRSLIIVLCAIMAYYFKFKIKTIEN